MERPTAFGYKSSEGLKLHHSSPLETLVRRTSSRRHAAKQREVTTVFATQIPPHPPPRLSSDEPASPPRPFANSNIPDSPLLHSRFRGSAASAMTNGSVLNYYMNHSKSSLHDCETDEGHYDDVFGEQEQRHASGRQRQSLEHSPRSALRHLASSSNQPPVPNLPGGGNFEDGMKPSTSILPTVVVSSPSDEIGIRTHGSSRQPIASGSSPRLNFSRPGRPPILSSEEQKRQVLERNSRRLNSPRTTQSPTPLLPVFPVTGTYDKHLSPGQYAPAPTLGAPPNAPPLSSSHHPTCTPSSVPSSLRAGPTSNVYSNPGGKPRPNITEPSTSSRHPKSQPPQPLTPSTENDHQPSTQPSSPSDYLQLGIQYHECNRLKDSAICFEKSAKEQGGCGVGMLMWGLALRHGWGCEKNEKSGFRWLAKAAEAAVQDLEKARQGKWIDAKDVKVWLTAESHSDR